MYTENENNVTVECAPVGSEYLVERLQALSCENDDLRKRLHALMSDNEALEERAEMMRKELVAQKSKVGAARNPGTNIVYACPSCDNRLIEYVGCVNIANLLLGQKVVCPRCDQEVQL